MINRRVLKFGALVVALLVFSTIAYAFAASIVVPASNAGIGAGTVSGYTVNGIEYTLAPANPSNLDSVQITLNTAATEVRARIAGGAWVVCTGAGTTWDCALGSTVLAANNLEVTAFTNVP
jgi:hypothetical protein